MELHYDSLFAKERKRDKTMIVIRLICIVIGYVFGLFQTGYIYGKSKGMDIRKYGSGNAGSTNVLRVMGVKAGAITFLGDCLKCVLAILIVRLIFKGNHADILPVLSMYAGLGTILGHNYPFYMGFKGGKGIAVTAGLIIMTTNIWGMLVCLLVFVGVVYFTRYVSVGSLTVVVFYLMFVVGLGALGKYAVTGPQLLEIYAIAFLVVISAYWRHRANIKRLATGTENKFSIGKKQ